MKTITLEKPGHFVLKESADPNDIAPGEALVRVHRVGICGTDIHAFSGTQPFFSYPRILGHELGVEVVKIGANDRGIKVGDRCSVEPYVNCQTCIACRKGRPNCCANMRVIGVHLDGGMRDWFIVPARKLHKANSLSFEQIALVETLAIGAHAVSRASVQSDDVVLVIGAGPIGLSVIQFAKANARVVVMDVSDVRLDFCREQLGVPDCINAKSEPLEAIRKITNGDMASVVIDATGNLASMKNALSFLSNAGRLVYVGLAQGEFSLNDPEFHRRETTLMGSRNALPDDFAAIIRLVEEGKIDTGPWITHRASAAEMVKQFGDWVKPGSGLLKGMIEF